MSSEVVGDGRRRALALQLLDLVRDFVLMSGRSIAGSGDVMKKDCTDLIRRIALLIHLAEEITNFHGGGGGDNFEELNESGSSSLDCLSEVVGAIQAAKRLLYAALTFCGIDDDDASASATSTCFGKISGLPNRCICVDFTRNFILRAGCFFSLSFFPK